jgi:HSP20 family protein
MTLIKRKESNFPSVWDDLFSKDFFRTPTVSQAGLTVPAVNIKETTDNYTLDMAVAGMKKEDFNINLNRNILTISSESSDENVTENKEENYTRMEFNYQSFERNFALPEAASKDRIEATYKEGVLRIVIPKKEEAKNLPQNIKIK